MEPTMVAKAAAAVVSGTHTAAEAAGKPDGAIAKLLGVNVLRNDLQSLHEELQKFGKLVDVHHGKHEQTTAALGILLSKFDGLRERVVDRLDAADKLADERAKSQDRALDHFESRLTLLARVLEERTRQGL